MTIKDSKYMKIYSENLLYLIFRNINGYFEKINESRYLTLVPTNESKEKIKQDKELWNNIRDFIKSLTNSSDDYNEN